MIMLQYCFCFHNMAYFTVVHCTKHLRNIDVWSLGAPPPPPSVSRRSCCLWRCLGRSAPHSSRPLGTNPHPESSWRISARPWLPDISHNGCDNNVKSQDCMHLSVIYVLLEYVPVQKIWRNTRSFHAHSTDQLDSAEKAFRSISNQ